MRGPDVQEATTECTTESMAPTQKTQRLDGHSFSGVIVRLKGPWSLRKAHEMCKNEDSGETRTVQDGADEMVVLKLFLDEHDFASMLSPATSADSATIQALQADGVKHEPTTTSKKAQTRQPERVGVHTGKRRREEITALREESAILQERLNQLKKWHDERSADRERRWVEIHASRAIADAQRKRRAVAELERGRLRALIEQHTLTVLEMHSFITSHETEAAFSEVCQV